MGVIQKVVDRIAKTDSCLCLGLDTALGYLPPPLLSDKPVEEALFDFNRRVIEENVELCAAIKINLVFYYALGEQGLRALRATTMYIRQNHPDVPTFADCKRSEMGLSATMAAREIFESLQFDFMMVTPWFGVDSISPCLAYKDHGVVVYVHDSNPSAPELQDVKVLINSGQGRQEMPLYQYVTRRVLTWNTTGNIMVEAGLTYPEALRAIRSILGEEVPMLVAGLGPQGGNPEDLRGLFGKDRSRMLVNVSRGIIAAGVGLSDPFTAVASAVKHYHEIIRRVR